MALEVVIGAVIVAAAAVLALVWFVSSRRRRPKPGVAIRVDCPEDHLPAEVRIGKRTTGELAVLACDRFPSRPIGCRQACFIEMPSGDADARVAKET